MKNDKQMILLFRQTISTIVLLSTPFLIYAETPRNGLLTNAEIGIYDDNNILRDDTNKISDSSINIAPQINYLTQYGKHDFSINYQGDYANYSHENAFNYDNHDVRINATLNHPHRLQSRYKINYQKQIEKPGTSNAVSTLSDTFNEYEQKSGEISLLYGTSQSIGQLIFDYQYRNKKFNNNNQSFRDTNKKEFKTTFYYRVMPKTRVLLEARLIKFDYLNGREINNTLLNQSNSGKLFLTGVEWQTTNKITGTFKIGHQSKDYNDEVFNDISDVFYNLATTWKPNTYTSINLTANKKTTESAQLDVAGFVSNSYSINIKHQVLPKTSLDLFYKQTSDDVVTQQNRTDKRYTSIIEMNHELRSWLQISLNYQYHKVESDIDRLAYKANIIGLSLTSTFN